MDITADHLKANKYTLKCMCVSLIVMVTCWTLNVFKVFIALGFVNMYISYHVTLFMVFPMVCSILEFAPESSDVNGGGSGEAEAIEKAKKAGLNTEDGISFCGNDVPFYLEMLSDFVTAQPEKEKTLNECFANSDWKNYQIHVHALKSNLRSIGAEDLSELARTLEKAA
ncbi:MAG: Hpt domain-containing protein [Ruminococcaceae bacterium]|nr:Hpt domain-containing protein [Oscillospiraceae bacterium]